MKFKVGDHVKCIVAVSNFCIKGSIGIIVEGPLDYTITSSDPDYIPVKSYVYAVDFNLPGGQENPIYIAEEALERITVLTDQDRSENQSIWDKVAK